MNAFESENNFSHAAETLYLKDHPLTSLVLLIIFITEAETAFVDHTQHSLKSIFPIKFLFSFSPVCFYLVLSTITAVLGLTCGSKAFAEAVALSNVGYYWLQHCLRQIPCSKWHWTFLPGYCNTTLWALGYKQNSTQCCWPLALNNKLVDLCVETQLENRAITKVADAMPVSFSNLLLTNYYSQLQTTVLNNKGRSFHGHLCLSCHIEISKAGFYSCKVPRFLTGIISPQHQEKQSQNRPHITSNRAPFHWKNGFNLCQKDGLIPISVFTF